MSIQSTESHATLRLLSLNTFLRPPLIHSPGGDFKDARLSHLTTILQNYDVCAFQECFGTLSSRRSFLISEAKKKGLEWAGMCPVPGLWRAKVDGGVVVVSRWKIQTVEWKRYGRGVHSDWLADKGVLYTAITAPISNNDSSAQPQTVHLFTTHLQASYDGPTRGSDTSATSKRLTQIHILKAFIDETLSKHYKPGDCALAVGDFNVDGIPEENKAKGEGGGHSEEYIVMMNILKGETPPSPPMKHTPTQCVVTDVIYAALGHHPVTTGVVVENGQVPCEEKALDYIFEIIPEGRKGNAKFVETKVEEFRVVGGENQKWTHLSDHLGVTTTVVLGSMVNLTGAEGGGQAKGGEALREDSTRVEEHEPVLSEGETSV
ncbi:Sphingomyelin phosphodiesterase 2, neutral membrane (Neutral sphingomyelinase) [Borealophlyctis nickersoniae]|nr:Sphingomyelin phosphodiesterase 2, neutral membrane (Neutral sphingomyelinase) [Borealophlyctis nickersoniae]